MVWDNFEQMSGSPKRPEPSQALLSQIAQQPGFVLLRDSGQWRLYRDPEEVLLPTDIDSLKESLQRIERHTRDGGEAAGILRYEAGYALEPRLNRLLDRQAGPLAWFGLYRKHICCGSASLLEDDGGKLLDNYRITISQKKYRAKVGGIRRLIRDGEVYQINFTTRVRFGARRSAWETFSALFHRHPVPYAAFLNTGSEQIVSLSPELFFEIARGRITVKPMKGTSDRGRYLEEDRAAAEQLAQSKKNRAENVMIVDLLRNDLGRICRTGSVKTPKLFEVERYPSVWQMTSTVQGELRNDCTVESLVSALFPSGSVTGAPKIRAMEHIARLEDSARGVYTGAIGFFAPGRARFNVAIRTLAMEQQHGIMGIGGGITYDSNSAAEWEECRWKAAFLVQSQPQFKLVETLCWERTYRLLKKHLARMRDSGEYFGFDFDETKLRGDLRRLTLQFSANPKRVRVVLSKNGEVEVTHTDFVAKRFGRVGIAEQRVSSQDRFLFHKTTNREVYSQQFEKAQKRKWDDALFFNERGELTEGTIHNVFVVKDGVWRTPPVTCGLLPGTLRAQILKNEKNACEAILGVKDLKKADAVYLCNSVRGLYPVRIQW